MRFLRAQNVPTTARRSGALIESVLASYGIRPAGLIKSLERRSAGQLDFARAAGVLCKRMSWGSTHVDPYASRRDLTRLQGRQHETRPFGHIVGTSCVPFDGSIFPTDIQMTTKKLLNQYVWLRDEIASHGPSPRLLVVRRCQNLVMRLYRAQQKYEAMKQKRPGLRIEFFECDRPLTATDAKNLTAASAVNRETTQILREWRNGRPSGVAA